MNVYLTSAVKLNLIKNITVAPAATKLLFDTYRKIYTDKMSINNVWMLYSLYFFLLFIALFHQNLC